MEVSGTVSPKRKVAIVGFAPTTRHQAPFFDDEFEIWGLNELYMFIPRFDRWFEMHRRDEFENSIRNNRHLEWLRQCEKPIYMQVHFDDIPRSVEYPKERMVKAFGNYFRSTFNYMLALAIDEQFTHIHLYGIDLISKGEYIEQRPSGEYFLGIARGRGIEVRVPPDSSLLREGAYGYDQYTLAEQYEIRLNELTIRKRKLEGDLNQVMGSIGECQGQTKVGSSGVSSVTQLLKLSLSSKLRQRIEALQDQHRVLAAELNVVMGAINECKYWMSRG